MKNHQSYPTGSKSFPRVNEIFVQNTQKTRGINMKKINGKGEEIILQKSTHHTTRSGDTMNLNKKMARICINIKLSVIGVVYTIFSLVFVKR